VDRARLVQPGFTVDETAAPVVAEICRRLDGIPLPIELAAARTKVCSVSELRKMLNDRFRLLIGGSKMVPPRQQTLLATIKWSFDLLKPEERRLLERLSIFSSGWTLEGAVAVASDDADQFAVLEQLAQLIDKSLIVASRSQSDATRYSMLETVRQYGLESLATAGAEAPTAKRHLEYFVTLAERLEPGIRNEQREALEQLVPELENLAQALRASERSPGGPELGLRLIAALGQYWLALGLLELGYRLTTEAVSRPEAQGKSPARARALFVATRFATFLGRHREAQDWANECLALARLLHDDHLEAGTLIFLGQTYTDLGDIAQGIAFLEQALQLARECADDEHIVRALNTLGGAHCELGNLELASRSFEEGLQIARDRRHFHAIAFLASSLAWTCLSLGQVERVWPLVLEALDLSSEAESKWTMEIVLEMVVRLVAAVQDWPVAARMLGADDAAVKLTGRKQQYPDRSSVVADIRNSLSKVDFEAAYSAGHALSIEQAIGEARAWIEKFAPSAPSVVVEFRRRIPAVGRR
jgi:non-specific serine/threonine protein kinase